MIKAIFSMFLAVAIGTTALAQDFNATEFLKAQIKTSELGKIPAPIMQQFERKMTEILNKDTRWVEKGPKASEGLLMRAFKMGDGYLFQTNYNFGAMLSITNVYLFVDAKSATELELADNIPAVAQGKVNRMARGMVKEVKGDKATLKWEGFNAQDIPCCASYIVWVDYTIEGNKLIAQEARLQDVIK